MWVTATYLLTAARHPFYRRPNQLLRKHGFDDFAERQGASFYSTTVGRPSLPPGIYFRLLFIGYFEALPMNSAGPFPVHASAGKSHRPQRRRRLLRVRPRSAHRTQFSTSHTTIKTRMPVFAISAWMGQANLKP
jgi:hypothetical protein